MKRSELKPGTVFSYKNFPSDMLFFVPPMANPPCGAMESMVDGDALEWNYEIDIVVPAGLLKQILAPTTPALTTQAHYVTGGIEAIDAIEAWGLDFLLGNVVKYIARNGRKPGIDAKEDLLKARNYLSRAIAKLEGRKAWE